jgi:cytochrome P450
MPTLGQIIAQIGTRIFLGPELCRNPAWQENAKGYTINVFMAVRAIRRWPLWSRPYVHWFLKDCKKARGHVRRAREILAPVIAARKETIAQAQKKGREADLPSDVITWTYLSQAKEDKKGVTEVYHPADFQLSLNMASVHTTSDLFSNVLFQLARHTEWIEPLHREAKEAFGDGKWEKQSLYHMKLADSMMKETQRMKPLGIRKSLSSPSFRLNWKWRID